MKKKLTTITLTVLSILLATTSLASVFVYYPLEITATPQAPGVVFQPGSNAGKPDIGANNLITVTLGENSTSATIRIHPTYQENYYKDVLNIVNNDDNAMQVYLIFDSVSNTLPGSIVKLFVYLGANRVAELDITNPSTGQATLLGVLTAEATWQLDFYVKIPEGTNIANTQYQAVARLVYTPSTETPPVNPLSGR